MGRHVLAFLIVLSPFVLPPGVRAQSPEQQIVNDAAAGLGGRDRVLAVKTLQIEGAGHDMNVSQSLRYDELGLLSDIAQIRDYKRSYDLANGRARFEATRQVQYPYFLGNAPARQVQVLDKDIAFNVAANGNATRVFAPGQINARRLEYLRHPLTIVRAALDPANKLANGRTQGNERLVDVTSGRATLTLAVDSSTRLPTRVVVMTDSPTLGDTAIETQFRNTTRSAGCSSRPGSRRRPTGSSAPTSASSSRRWTATSGTSRRPPTWRRRRLRPAPGSRKSRRRRPTRSPRACGSSPERPTTASSSSSAIT